MGLSRQEYWSGLPSPSPKSGIETGISGKIDFEIKAAKRDKEVHYIMIKGSIQEDITINIYAPNRGSPQ